MRFDGRRFLFGFFAIYTLFGDCFGLELRIEVPKAVLKGREVILKSFFDLEGDKLYSVKWYHNSAEFYRYTTTGKDSVKLFPIRGIHVVEEKSNATQVVLKHATRIISGQFSCEVTEDQPSFFTEMKTSFLEVVDPPINDPIIVGTKSKYKIGDYVKATCSADKSDPAVNLTWHINGRPVEGSLIRKFRKTVEGAYISSYSTLQFGVTEQLFNEGKLKLRCIANIHDVWQRSVERTIELRKQKQLDTADTAPAWTQTPSTDFSNEKYWLYVAKDSSGTTDGPANSNSSTNALWFNKSMFLVSVVFYIR